MTIEDYKQWLASFEALGLPAIDTDTCARILAVVYTLGNNEQIDYCPQCMADIAYMRRRFHLNGGEIPDSEIVEPFQCYVHEIETTDNIPEWAERLFKKRYGVKIYK